MAAWFKPAARSEKCVPAAGGLQPDLGHNLMQIIKGTGDFITN
jgi:hypothetical protein